MKDLKKGSIYLRITFFSVNAPHLLFPYLKRKGKNKIPQQ